MNKLLLFFILFAGSVSAQEINCKVVDSFTGRPLAYATISYQQAKEVAYSDSSGYFSLPKNLTAQNDSLIIQYLGYQKFSIASDKISKNNIFKLVPFSTELATVVVSTCKSFKDYDINKRTGGVNNYIGPGPEIKIIIIGRYLNNKGKSGYVKQLQFYEGIFNASVKVPVRLHWYKWNAAANMPGAEMTKQNIILYPYKKGWNSFDIPENSIYFSAEDIVLGLEFIYPVEFKKQFNSLTTVDRQGKWLMDMNHRWSLGMESSKDSSQRTFCSINNAPIESYNNHTDLYLKPALKFTIAVCEQ
jgi:hypothetical protein